jgi:hypothetical protein
MGGPGPRFPGYVRPQLAGPGYRHHVRVRDPERLAAPSRPAYVGVPGLRSCLYACRACRGVRAAYLGAGASCGLSRCGRPLPPLSDPGLVGGACLKVGAHSLRVPEEALAKGAEGSPRGPARARVVALAEARLCGRVAPGTLQAPPAPVEQLGDGALLVGLAGFEVGADGLSVSEVAAAAEVTEGHASSPGVVARRAGQGYRVGRVFSPRDHPRDPTAEVHCLRIHVSARGPGYGGTHPNSERGGAGLDGRSRHGPRALARSLA